ncbi:peroxidase domain-containing protein [Sarocladium implicatum]|nr:peroxidase domain-containing protein [Sarocladium implicatum]
MGEQLEALKHVDKRQASTELIGDLLTLSDSQLTATGKIIKGILTGSGEVEDLTSTYTLIPSLGTSACTEDKCCIWKHISNEMRTEMVGSAGRCTNTARQAVRLGFHDAGAWSKSTKGGGATGHIILGNECENRKENHGLEEVCAQMRIWYNKYKSYGISMADLIQWGANVATVLCPLGPRVRSFVGRKDSSTSPTGLMPAVTDSVDKLLSLFADKTFTAGQLVALVGAHTSSQQRFVDETRFGDPQDSTPGVWDVLFYSEVTDPNSPERVFKFDSDVRLSKDSRTKGAWGAFSGSTGQAPWNAAYSRAYIRMSLLGVTNINQLTECTKALPPFLVGFLNPDQALLDDFLDGPVDPTTAQKLMDGDRLQRIS